MTDIANVPAAAYAFEPETAAFVRRQDEERAAGPANPSIEELRAGYRAGLLATSVPRRDGVTVRDLTVPGAVDDRAARLYTPATVGASRGPLLLYVHGGGFAVGDLESHDALLRMVADAARLRVLALDYRRAPEHRFPAARDDVAAAYRWVRANAAALGVDEARIVLGGESAGGTHAVAAALALRDAGDPMPHALWILVPALDATGGGESHGLFATGAGRPAAEFRFLWSLYRPEPLPADDPGLSPLFADLRGLPPVRVYTAEFDPARSDGETFAARARDAGVDARVRRERGLIHQFPEITGVSPASRDAVVGAAAELAALLRLPGAPAPA